MFSYCNFCERAHDSWKVNDNELIYFVTDRWGGSSREPYAELNMSMNVGDCVDDVLYNRLMVARHSGLPLNRFVFASQVHGHQIATISNADLSEASYTVVKASDGLITRDENIMLCVMAADCVPVLLYDPIQRVIGAFHAGWRGVANSIVTEGLDLMIRQFHCQPENFKVFIGPSIGACCYEIKGNVMKAIEKSVPQYSRALVYRKAKPFLDLKKAIQLQLTSQGVSAKNIVRSNNCTKCKSSQYFSFRAETETGRFCAGIALNSFQ